MDNQDITTINTLIATTIDSANGFEEAARGVRASGLAAQFAELARDRWEVVETLEDEVRRMGGDPKRSGTAKGAAHRRWLDLKNVVAGSDRAVLQEVNNGETYLVTKYEAALDTTGLSETARRTVEDALASVRRGQERARGLSMTVGTSGESRQLNADWRRIGTTLGMAAAFGAAAFAATRMLRSRQRPATGESRPRGTDMTRGRRGRSDVSTSPAVAGSGPTAAAAANEMPSDLGSDAAGRTARRAGARRGGRDSDTAGVGLAASGSTDTGTGAGSGTGFQSPSGSTDADTGGFQASGGPADLSSGAGSTGSGDTPSGAGSTGSFGSGGSSGNFGRS